MFNLLKHTLNVIEFCFVEPLKLEIINYASKNMKGVRNSMTPTSGKDEKFQTIFGA